VLGILKDLGDVPKVNILGYVMGEEMGEDVTLGDAESILRLAAEDALIHSLAPVVQAERVVKQSTLELPDGPFRYSPQVSNSGRSNTIL